MIRRVKFLGIPVRDQDRALAFYTEKLGFVVMTDAPFSPKQRWIEIKPPKGDTGIVLFTPDGHEDRIGTFVNTSLECDDLDKTCREFKAMGVEFVKEPTKQDWGSFAIIKDSEGNQLVIAEGK